MICCVEDENAIRELMVYTLKASGFDAVGFDSLALPGISTRETLTQYAYTPSVVPEGVGDTVTVAGTRREEQK